MFNNLSEFFRIFADETRLKILNYLLDKESCVSLIADDLMISQSAVSHQLRTLKDNNLVVSKKEGQMVIYSLSDDHIRIILKYGMEHISEALNEKISK